MEVESKAFDPSCENNIFNSVTLSVERTKGVRAMTGEPTLTTKRGKAIYGCPHNAKISCDGGKNKKLKSFGCERSLDFGGKKVAI